MDEALEKNTIIKKIQSFFPLQLLFAQIKYNLISIFFWLFLFAIILDNAGSAFGVPFLFLSPEYLNEVSLGAFFMMGFAVGGFIMGFNTYSYIKIGSRFPFLTTLSRPFFKFCINNSIIPTLFYLLFIIQISVFQNNEELQSKVDILLFITSLIAGSITFFTLSFLYFFRVGKKNKYPVHDEQSTKPISSITHKHENWFNRYNSSEFNSSIYIGKGLKLFTSRSSSHFDQSLVEKVFAKNKINGSIFEIATIVVFFILGAFHNYDIFEVPAGASIVLLFTISLMLFSALHSWFKTWVYPLLLLTILTMNSLSESTPFFKYTNYAYGLDYENTQKDEYSIEAIKNITTNKIINDSTYKSYLSTLENWKAKTGEAKPKLVIINTSGGGSRSALWTVTVLQKSDEALNSKLSKHTQLITGASGGMVGASYYRELLLQEQLNLIENAQAKKYRNNIGKDMLNKLSFTASTNDIFIRYQTLEYNGLKYTKDRGYAFEEQLLKNTDQALNHNLGYYAPFEKNGSIPTIVFSPTIINDGRRLLISSQNLNFLTANHGGPAKMTKSNENIDIHSLLKHQDVGQLRFTSALRSSATFPFVMPMVTLPTTPEIQLMDAGLRDNYGGKTMIEFLFVMKDWIKENTSGVIVLQIRDTKKVLDDESYSQVSFIDKLTLPFGNMYKNFPRVQDFDQEELMKLSTPGFDFPIDLISFNLRERSKDRISLSWHLTQSEKIKIENAFESNQNQNSLQQLKRIL